MITPLQPREFFRGIWRGEGEILPNPLLRSFLPRQTFHYSCNATWLSDTIWVVDDRFEFAAGGRVLRGRMFAELVAADRAHVTADDMPLGADMLLHERGFRFTPYWVLGAYREGGRVRRLGCFDECTMDERGFLHDTIRMRYCGFPVATMRIGPIEMDGSA